MSLTVMEHTSDAAGVVSEGVYGVYPASRVRYPQDGGRSSPLAGHQHHHNSISASSAFGGSERSAKMAPVSFAPPAARQNRNHNHGDDGSHYGRIPAALQHRVHGHGSRTESMNSQMTAALSQTHSQFHASQPAVWRNTLQMEREKAEQEEADKPIQLTQEQVAVFSRIYKRLENPETGLVLQPTLKRVMFRLQERTREGGYLYLFSENQMNRMMPSREVAPDGLDLRMFLNVMAQIMQISKWSAEHIADAMQRHEGHYANLPGKRAKKSAGGCNIL